MLFYLNKINNYKTLLLSMTNKNINTYFINN